MPRMQKKVEEDVITYSVLDRDTHTGDFLNDPDLHRDQLPQPYRRIDKVLQEVLDDAWSILERKDIEKMIEMSKPRAEKFAHASVLDGLENLTCLCSSNDEQSEFLFIGLNGGLACVDVAAMSVVDKIDLNTSNGDPANIAFIYTNKIKLSTHLIAALSDTGVLYLHIFSYNRFFQIQPITDNQNESDRKFIYRKCEISANCDYLAILVESKANIYESFIEVYKCPKDAWSQSVDNFNSGSLETSKKQHASHSNFQSSQSENFESGAETIESSSSVPSQQHQNLPNISKPVLACRIRPPNNQFKFQTVGMSSPYQLLKTVENSLDSIGVGINHSITKQHLDARVQYAERLFNVQLSEEQVNQIFGGYYNLDNIKINADFKFLPANRIIPSGSEFINNDQVISLCVCWNNSFQILFYPLGKVNKELESKYEHCMPFSTHVNEFEITKCGNLLAVLLRNNNLIVLDLNSGIERCAVHFDIQGGLVKKTAFLPSTISNIGLHMTNTVQVANNVNLICLTNHGTLHLIDCQLGSKEPVRPIFIPKLANLDDKMIYFDICKNLPNLILTVSETRKVYLLDIERGQLVCELVVSLNPTADSFEFDTLSNQAAFTLRNEQLFLKYNSNKTNKSKLYCHSLKLVSKLNDYFSTKYLFSNNCLPVYGSMQERTKNLMKDRIEQVSMRQNRLKNIWNELSQSRNNASISMA